MSAGDNVESFKDADKKRNEEDLDSITMGSPSKIQVKLYVNTRTDNEEDIINRLDMLVSCAKSCHKKLEE